MDNLLTFDLLALALPLPFFVWALLAHLGVTMSDPIQEDQEGDK